MHKKQNITHSYTKHYYAGSERILSKVGGGGLSDIDTDPHEEYNIQGEYGTVLAEKQKVARAEYEMAWKCLETVNPVFENYLMCTENGLTCPFFKKLYSMKEATVPENDLYFYHSDHLGSASWITNANGQAIQHLLYLPFGETMVNQRTTSWSSRYSFSAKEKDEESGYSYFGARYYDSDISIWLSVDPMASKYPSQTPYLYCGNNPLKVIDPNGEDEWELNTVTGNFTKTGDKGGDKTDHYNIGKTNEKGDFVSSQTQSVDRDGKSNINSFRISETDQSTISAFHVPDAKEGEINSGFFLEPKGPSTEKSGLNQRIPEGSYDVMKNDGKKYPDTPKLFNDNVTKERGILIHIGNSPGDTRGCLLPGSAKGNNFVGGIPGKEDTNSKSTLSKLNNYMNNKGHSNVRVNIFNVIK